jgi:hypothetical protein
MQKEPRTVVGMEIPCHTAKCTMLKKTELLLNGINSTQNAFCGSKQRNFSGMDETVLEFVLREMRCVKELEVATHVKTMARLQSQHYSGSKTRTTLVQKLLTHYLEKLIT